MAARVTTRRIAARPCRRRPWPAPACGEAPVIDGVGVALDFFERAVTADRLDLVSGAVVLGHDAARGLAQARGDAMLAEAGCRDLLAEPIAEAVAAKGAAPFVC